MTTIEYGRINPDTTERNAPMLAGNLVLILTGGLIHTPSSFLWLQNYDWEITKYITMVERDKKDLTTEEFKEKITVTGNQYDNYNTW